MEQVHLLPVLISVVGGGTIVPLIYSIYSGWRNRDENAKRGTAQVEEIASHAAREAVEATRGAMEVLREQLRDGHSEIETLRAAREEDRKEIARLRRRVRELTNLPPEPG